MSLRRSASKRREKPPWERFKDHFRHFTAFMFSNVGIILLVVFYTIGGAFIFQSIELKYGKQPEKQNGSITAFYTEAIWAATSTNITFFNKDTFSQKVDHILLEYQRAVVLKVKKDQETKEQQWSFSGAFLYCLTVITTIGYGNISTSSDWGKLMTILYAIIGMPLFLLYLSNIGDVLAKSFKWIYSKVCLCRICPGVAKRRIIRERRKLKEIALTRALQDMEDGSGSNSSSTSGSSSVSSEATESSSQTTSALENASNAYTENSSDIEREILGSTDEIIVPLTVCIMIMITYILSGAILFSSWEDWNILNGSYFCFISLSSIGFGDLVPGEKVITADMNNVNLSFIFCAIYLLLGMALIAMCFNLMQEQVIHKMRAFKRGFKACFRCIR